MNTLSRKLIQRSFWECSFIFITLLLACFGLSPAAQAARHGLPRLPGPVATDSNAAQALISPATTPRWTSSFTSTTDTGLVAASAVYDPATNTMMVFGGLDFGMEGSHTNAALLYAPANNENGDWITLIANGALGSPPARDFHSAVYDSTNNRMIVFGGESSSSTALNDVWVLSNANG